MHIDVKKLGRIQGASACVCAAAQQHYNPRRTDATGKQRKTVGVEYVHVAVDDHSRLAYAELLSDEKATTDDRLPPPRRRLLRAGMASRSSAC